MYDCICSTCRNLKGIIDENGAVGAYECEFGFPSDECTDECERVNCGIICPNYASDDEETKMVNCALCGKELRQLCNDSEEGDAYCIDCYLKKT